MNINAKGVGWFILHCLLFSILSVATKWLLNYFHVFEIIFIQTFFATIFLMPFAIKKLKEQANIYQNLTLHALRSLCWVGAAAMYFYAITQISLTKAVAIVFTIPIFTSLLAVLFLKERIKKQQIFTLICGVIGMLIIVQPGYNYEIGALWAVGAALLWSLTDIIIKILGRTHNIIVKTFFFTTLSALFSLPLAWYFGEISHLNYIYCGIVMAIIFIIDLISISKSYRNADLTIVMPFSFLQLLFIAIIGYLVFDEKLSIETFIGAVIIIGGIVFAGQFKGIFKNRDSSIKIDDI